MRDADGREATINRCTLPGDETDLHHEQTEYILSDYLNCQTTNYSDNIIQQAYYLQVNSACGQCAKHRRHSK